MFTNLLMWASCFLLQRYLAMWQPSTWLPFFPRRISRSTKICPVYVTTVTDICPSARVVVAILLLPLATGGVVQQMAISAFGILHTRIERHPGRSTSFICTSSALIVRLMGGRNLARNCCDTEIAKLLSFQFDCLSRYSTAGNSRVHTNAASSMCWERPGVFVQ